MFIALLIVTFLTAALVSGLCALLFRGPLKKILDQVMSASLGSAWLRYLTFAVMVVGISGGVSRHNLERYIDGQSQYQAGEHQQRVALELTTDRWVFEIYLSIVGALQAIAWMLLVFFIFTLIAYVFVRIFDRRHSSVETAATAQDEPSPEEG